MMIFKHMESIVYADAESTNACPPLAEDSKGSIVKIMYVCKNNEC